MAIASIPDIRIGGIAAAVPANTEHNQQLTILPERERGHLIQMIGIDERRVAPKNICASDLCTTAALKLMETANISATDIGIVVFVTQTPDYPMPGNSMLVQQQLGISSSALLLDIHQGCAGYVYGLLTISSLMQTSGTRYGLLLVGDTITHVLSPQDRTTLPIFSDAGTATLMQFDKGAGKIHFNVGADGKGVNAIRIKAGGTRFPFCNESLAIKEESPGVGRAPIHMTMEGIDVLNYSLKNVVPNVKKLLEYTGNSVDDVDYFIFHQANRILNESIHKRIGIPPEKAPETLSVFGNTSSATIPITISYRLGNILGGDAKKLLLSGFGVGFSWGSALLDIGNLISPELIESDGR